ncbi:MAG: rhodanese-like domain-containing protein [Thermodesulfovibrionales bacterium]|nr:rhodanese-like domain-containing protein [Thermodesulfovibrionales bacterium]
MKRLGLFLIFLVALTVIALPVFSQTDKPKIAPICKQCHAPDEKVLRGSFVNVSQKAGTIQVQIGPAAWIVKYDDNTKVIGAEKITKIAKEKEVAIEIEERQGQLYAKTVSVKPPARVPEEKLISVEELSKLIELGPEKGKFFLVDSRPAPRYHEGHIPYAVSIYDAEFDKHIDKLPKDKDILLIFYCGGVT